VFEYTRWYNTGNKDARNVLAFGRMTKAWRCFDMASISGIYKIVNKVNGHCYIGSAIDTAGRWSRHVSELRYQRHHSVHLQSAWNLYGADNFFFTVIEKCETSQLIKREQYYIDTVVPEYNICKVAGSSLGRKHTLASIEKISIAKKNQSQETRDKISASKKGQIISQEAREKIRSALLGIKRTIEEIEKSRKSRTGARRTPEQKERISQSLIGRKPTPQAIENNRKANTGKKRTVETKKRLSDARRLWWSKKKENK
jgi:group I intron endonuclease